ncbi:hypothetical protein ALC56_10288 [Trachymyrmex septentrionalis]|uniref:Uncharacterized protein n=1 Tax=Trachymyrmex septentrionalis TaxID=34720 RepID=A0A151JUI4_9HYME|nr:hypothetical protein ALC56_10288 [Trachymyrmex septentrionalis]
MTETLEKALAPLLIIGSFCNLCMIEYPRGQSRAYLSYLYALAKWGSLIYFYYYPNLLSYWRKNDMKIYITDISPLVTITLILISFSHFKELKMCLRKLAIVDDSLEVLGVPKKYQRLRNWIIRIIVGWIVHIFYQLLLSNVIIFFVLQYDVILFLIITLSTFLMTYPEKVITLSALIPAVILGLVLHMCIRLFCKLFLLRLCVKIFPV